ncbi:MAG: 5-formyltetrahydrofolate cyclo-ligase [Euryarchaeota archaeon]|nr:5-formyltetrahydrofolate cyclo-ligase [Euryarchaeota archaeon]
MKPGLRLQFRAARDALGAKARQAAAAEIGRRLAGLDRFAQARRVVLYASYGSEVDTWPLMTAAHEAGRLVALPRMEGKELALHEYRPGDTLAANAVGIPEPSVSSPRVKLDAADVVVVPGLAFDRRGHRLGYGGGYYDRLLRTSPHAYRIGLAYAFQLVDRLPSMHHDEPLDAVVTDSGVHVYPRRHH